MVRSKTEGRGWKQNGGSRRRHCGAKALKWTSRKWRLILNRYRFRIWRKGLSQDGLENVNWLEILNVLLLLKF